MGLVSKIATLTTLSPAAAEWLNTHIVEFQFPKNKTLLKEHHTCEYLYYIKEGMLSAIYYQDTKEICNWIAVEDDFATSYYSFIAQKPSYEIIDCLEDTTVQAISYANLQKLYATFPETEKAGRIILEEYYLRIEEHLLSLRFKNAAERYNTFTNARPQLINRAPLGRVASYLGMTQETLSRVRAEYRG